MPGQLFDKVYKFLTTSPLGYITAFSVVYQVIEDEPWVEQEELRRIVNDAISVATANVYSRNITAQNKLLRILAKFDDAFEGVCSLRDMEMAVKPLTDGEIKKSMKDLKKKLAKSKCAHAGEIRQNLEDISISDLTWRDPIASQVIDDDSVIVKNLDGYARQSFMKLAQNMQTNVPDIINEKCNEFVENFRMESSVSLPEKLKHNHNNTWKETHDELVEVTDDILNTLDNIWKNPAFGTDFASTQSEGTYVTDIVVPLLRATLRRLPVGKINLLSTAEKQSVASAYRRGEGRQGKRPDVMFIEVIEKKLYELMFVESSRLVCSESKKDDDKVKLWREMNDGMDYVHRSRKPEKNEFGILGIQVAGEMMHLNVLIKDTDDVHWLFCLRSIEIPVQPTDEEGVLQLIEPFLLIRNILIVNISLLTHALEVKSERQKRRSSTVSSDKE